MSSLYSIEAEHGVIGAMLNRPELIDTLSDNLTPDAFYFAGNRELYALILRLHNEGRAVDVITLDEAMPELPTGDRTLPMAAEIQYNTPSVANAQVYAGIVRDRAVMRQLHRVGSSISELAAGSGSLDEKIAQAQAMALSIDTDGSDGECKMIGQSLLPHIDELERRLEMKRTGVKIDGLSTGLPDLDNYLCGMKAGQMIVLAGRPAMGKTSLAMNIAADAAVNQKKKVLVVSLEMSEAQLMDRLLASVGGVPLPKIKDGTAVDDMPEQLTMAVARLKDAQLAISDVPVMTLPRIRSVARRQRQRMGGMDLIVIDYLGLIEGEGKGRVEDVTAMSRQIKLLAREMGCPVIILSQLNRGCEQRPDKRPVLSDLRESGAIEQDADMAIFVYRDEVYNENTNDKGIAEILVRKNRDGKIGTVRTLFQGEKSRFTSIAPEHFS